MREAAELLRLGSRTEFILRWSSNSSLDLMQKLTASPVALLVIEHEWAGPTLLRLLARIRNLALDVRTIVVGAMPEPQVFARGLPFGLRGCIPLKRLRGDLIRALSMVIRGEMWLPRCEMSKQLDLALQQSSDNGDRASWRPSELTTRELAVLREAMLGDSNKEIAHSLSISEQTVKVHLQHVYRKLHVHRRIDLLLLREEQVKHDAR
jgi:DNA-binding NarL/FixJ family response regulator